jgi:ribosomal protein L27
MSKTEAAVPPELRESHASVRLSVDSPTVTSGRSSSAARTKVHPGANVAKGGDDTLFATADGTISYGTRRGRREVSVRTEG